MRRAGSTGSAGTTGRERTARTAHSARPAVPVRVAVLTISDLGAAGKRADTSGDAIVAWAAKQRFAVTARSIVPDESDRIAAVLLQWADQAVADLILTTGGTGLAPRDVTPEATLAVADKVLPGFGEQMRAVSLKYVPTAILSRQVAVVRRQALILNLPGQPKAIKETLDGVFAAVPYCIDLIGGPYIETDEAVVKAFRPKSAIRPKPGK